LRGFDCQTLIGSARPPLCGTAKCPCPRSDARAAFSRWDAALELFKSLDAGWIHLPSVSAVAYGDIVHMQTARTEEVARLRAMLEGEAIACKHPDGWVDSELRRLINA